ncbi:MAG: hypothetical protein KGD65_16925 [Candidatus Lokiarchaeota archaeon]|nr:hypothetical protein [Candidatus Lokiarchaeota archaeon]
MTFQESVMDSIQKLFHNNTVISISGKSGTGKTSLSLFLMGNFLTASNPYVNRGIWIQASESFSKKRLESLFREEREKLKYLSNNIFVIPGNGPFPTYESQFDQLKRFSKNDYLFPPETRFLIIDNISHHLRFKFSQINDIEQRSYLINNFYDTILNPLIFRCQRESINLLLIHEVSFDVKTQRTRPYFSKLYERIRGVNISLSKCLISNQRMLDLAFNNRQSSFKFNLTNNGFVFSE